MTRIVTDRATFCFRPLGIPHAQSFIGRVEIPSIVPMDGWWNYAELRGQASRTDDVFQTKFALKLELNPTFDLSEISASPPRERIPFRRANSCQQQSNKPCGVLFFRTRLAGKHVVHSNMPSAGIASLENSCLVTDLEPLQLSVWRARVHGGKS